MRYDTETYTAFNEQSVKFLLSFLEMFQEKEILYCLILHFTYASSNTNDGVNKGIKKNLKYCQEKMN